MRISVIIAALNEEEMVGAAVRSALNEPGTEVIVAEGGSSDATGAVAREAGARVVHSLPGRARQLNAGAAAAGNGVLLFLHADTLLPPGYAGEVRRILMDRRTSAGAFSLGIGHAGLTFRIIEAGANWRSRLLRLPYGDQAIFLTAPIFHQAGGFPDVPVMEDFVFVRRLRRLGRVAVSPLRVETSARRWKRLGPWRTTLFNQGMVAACLLGVPLERIARWYDGRD